jgi:predicted transcriptional regulator
VEPRDRSALDLGSRRRIYAHVVDHPGEYLREVHRALGGSMGALEYHLAQLEKAGLVRVENAENKRLFPASMDPREARALTFLRQAPARAVLLALLGSGEASHGDVMRQTGLRSSTLSYHAAKLVEAGLLARERRGRETRYRALDETLVVRLLVQHRSSFLDRVVDAFIESFEGMGRRGGP